MLFILAFPKRACLQYGSMDRHFDATETMLESYPGAVAPERYARYAPQSRAPNQKAAQTDIQQNGERAGFQKSRAESYPKLNLSQP